MKAVKAAGYKRVTLDLEGFRSGNLNADPWPRPPPQAAPRLTAPQRAQRAQ